MESVEKVDIDSLMDIGGDVAGLFDVPDSDEAKDLEDLKRELDAPESEQFNDLDELFEAERIEVVGQWEECPFVPGFWFHLAHTSAAAERYRHLESAWKEKKGLPLEYNLAKKRPDVQYRLFLASLFGPAVRKWESRRDGFVAIPYNLDGYKKLMKSRRFSNWIISTCGDIQRFRDKKEKALGETSPAESSGS